MRAVVYDRHGSDIVRPQLVSRFQGEVAVYPVETEMTGRAFFSMLIFVGFVVAVMWFAVLPSLTTFRPTLP